MIEKICKQCGARKGSSEFYAHAEMKDGLLSRCIPCVLARVRKHRSVNVDKIREYDRARGRTQKRLDYQKKLGRERRSDRVKYGIAWRERNPEKRAAHILAGNAVRAGRLLKGVCEVCKSKKVEAHHEDYAKPLEVKWLCRKHHAEIHRKYK